MYERPHLANATGPVVRQPHEQPIIGLNSQRRQRRARVLFIYLCFCLWLLRRVLAFKLQLGMETGISNRTPASSCIITEFTGDC